MNSIKQGVEFKNYELNGHFYEFDKIISVYFTTS